MNEQIKKLQNAAGIQVVRTLMREDENTEVKLMLTEKQLEKFAELIVWECLEVVERQFGGAGPDGVEWDRAIDFTYEDMKKHFGVE